MPDANFGWSARDAACYSYDSFVLNEDPALVITDRPPRCRFWNMVVWNQFMATYGVTHARCSVNGHGAQRWRFGDDRGLPAGDDTPELAEHTRLSRGNPASRWFLSDGSRHGRTCN